MAVIIGDVDDPPVTLRERTRRAVQQEIAEAAQRLFLDRGYEATTIADIAAETGMSQRSVFRYFPTKEAIVLGKLDFVAEEMRATLENRPWDEPVWDSLRTGLDLFVPHLDVPGEREAAESIQRVVFSTPDLLATYLEKLHLIQDAAETAIRERAHSARTPYGDDDPTPRALVASAFGCLIAAQKAWLANGTQRAFADFIDQAMAAIQPCPA